jgi:replicative DNA helicase
MQPLSWQPREERSARRGCVEFDQGQDRSVSDAAPTLGDLRQSGDIQYEASTVVLLHREVDENAHVSEAGWMIIAKQRGGKRRSPG